MAKKLFCKLSVFIWSFQSTTVSHATCRITCREQVPLLSPRVTSAVVTLLLCGFSAWIIYAGKTTINRNTQDALSDVFFQGGQL